jgi:Uma2 family endonuclease
MEDDVQLLPRRDRPWVFEELADLLPDDDQRYEVVDGNLVVTPPPSHLHQFVSLRIRDVLAAAAPPGWLAMMEFALPLGPDGRVPLVAVIRSDAPLRDRTKRYPVGPEWFGLVVEVVSARTAKTDRFFKPAEYAAAGIPFFWRVELDPDAQVQGYRLADGSYAEAEDLPAPWGSVLVDPTLLLP